MIQYLHCYKKSLNERRDHLDNRFTLPGGDEISHPEGVEQQSERSKKYENIWKKRTHI